MPFSASMVDHHPGISRSGIMETIAHSGRCMDGAIVRALSRRMYRRLGRTCCILIGTIRLNTITSPGARVICFPLGLLMLFRALRGPPLHVPLSMS